MDTQLAIIIGILLGAIPTAVISVCAFANKEMKIKGVVNRFLFDGRGESSLVENRMGRAEERGGNMSGLEDMKTIMVLIDKLCELFPGILQDKGIEDKIKGLKERMRVVHVNLTSSRS